MLPVEPWCRLADLLLHREAVVTRLADGVIPRDFAGMYVDSTDLDRVLSSLPGMTGPSPGRAEEVRAAVGPALAAARAALGDELSAGVSTFARVARSAQLDRSEAEVLAVVAAVEIDPGRQRLVAYIQDSVQLPRLTLTMLGRLFIDGPDEGWSAVAPTARLRNAALVTVDVAHPWAIQMVAVPDRVAWALRGDDAADPALPPGSARRDAARTSDAQRPSDPSDPLLLVVGGDRTSRLQSVDASWPGRASIVSSIPTTPLAWAALVREATIDELVAVLEVESPLDAVARDEITRAAHLPWALTSPVELPLECLPDRPWTELHLSSGAAGAEDWEHTFDGPPQNAPPLDREQLRLAAAHAHGNIALLPAAVRRLAGGHLDGVAVRVRPRRTWDDLVLPPDQMVQLHELAMRHRLRSTVYGDWGFSPHLSTGIVALFSGPSGTGKTLAAEIIAGAIGVDLYKVDLAGVVSKYIGQTEKNLERIFTAAAVGDLVLFFDEADALFGKRSEVSDSHDRYANIEVAYLLQRLETYDGLVVLATNLQRNIDAAFLRRISVAVDFTLPDERERRAIWGLALPVRAPTGDLDLDFLARQFKVTGGVIRNAALTAAFLAAESQVRISTELLAVAMRREFEKLGRLVTEKEFGPYFPAVGRRQPATTHNGQPP